MVVVAAISGTILILLVLWEGFETVVLPRRVTRRFRFTYFFYRWSWLPWAKIVRSSAPPGWQETLLSFFGPLSLLLLMSIWVGGLITGFALLHWSGGSALLTRDGSAGFIIDLYLSGTTFFTLGLGDVVPRNNPARLLVMIESGMGFGFLALVISYLPALNQSFARREVSISLLDARAGSPPTTSEMLCRHGRERGAEALRQLLYEWERWSAELLEGHLSYPIIAYFRSQHDNQSWLAALTVILDTSSLILAGLEGPYRRQAELTFAMARHAVVDLSLIFRTKPRKPEPERLPPEKLAELRVLLADSGWQLPEGRAVGNKLAELRQLYEPYVHALAAYFQIELPLWVAGEKGPDNWQVTMWDRPAAGKGIPKRARREHF